MFLPPSILLALLLQAPPPKPAAWVAESARGSGKARVTFRLDTDGARRGCSTPPPARAAAIGRKLGLGAPFAAGARLKLVPRIGNPVLATISTAVACKASIYADVQLAKPIAGSGDVINLLLVLPATADLGPTGVAGVSAITLAPAATAAIAAQLDARLAGALAHVRRDSEVARQARSTAEENRSLQARGRKPFEDRIGEMADAVVSHPSGLKLHARRVRFSTGAAFDYIRADWYTPCPGRCAGNFPDNRGVGASLEAWFTAAASPRLVKLDLKPLRSKFLGWGVGVPGDDTAPVVVAPLADGRALLLTSTYRGDGFEDSIVAFNPTTGIPGLKMVFSICECGD
ncbi:MAG: hypothetical protein ACRD01_00040 [Terriglobales bacterium]